MSLIQIDKFVLGMPIAADKRAELRRLSPSGLIPARVSGSVERPCIACGLACWVGPRSAATKYPVLCPWCVLKIRPIQVMDLGNPESHLEGDS